MDIDKAFAQLLQYGQRHRAVVDKGTALTCGCNLSTHDALSIILYLILIKQLLQTVSCNIEGTLDNAFSGSIAYGCHLGTLTGEKTYSAQKDRLTRTCLTRNYREACSKIKVKRLDECIVLYM